MGDLMKLVYSRSTESFEGRYFKTCIMIIIMVMGVRKRETHGRN